MPPHADASKLFKVLVLGGLSMAIPACSSGTTGDDAGSDAAVDAGQDQAAQTDAQAGNDSGTCTVYNQCPTDCSHGMCGW
jgi:hypothetical protein